MARIECHYFYHQAFIGNNQILKNAQSIAHLPVTIVHGRYDVICPLENAWALHAAWSGSALSIVADAGHSAAEAGTRRRLIEATDQFAEQLQA